MWIYEYGKFDCSGFLPVGPYHSREEAARAMKEYADRFGAIVQGPREIEVCSHLTSGTSHSLACIRQGRASS